jgi:cysteine-rich repeat protein
VIRTALLIATLACASAACSRTELAIVARCGNGVRDVGEECDDGNAIDHDGCSNRCRLRECGNGIVDPGEECDLGADNEDRPALELIHEAISRGRRPVMPVDRAESVRSFYSYFSESSHTGFEGRDLSALFLYRDTSTETLGLVTHHGIDEDTSGITLPEGRVDLKMEGMPSTATIAIADEDHELFFETDDRVVGLFEFWRNTDGGALEGLPFPGDWRIDVSVVFTIGITRWSYVPENETGIELDPGLVASLRAYPEPSACRTDCRIPRCGDDFVDGGEVCDDGNTRGGDGCAADCLSLAD